jgi:hypothetical protein
MSSANNTPETASKGRAATTIVAVLLVILALGGAATWYLFFRGGTDADERVAYDRIVRYENLHQLDSLGNALEEYFDTYNSDAFHYSQLKELSDRFFTERADWQAAAASLSAQAVRHFIDAHPDGFYQTDAEQKLDSLVFAEALATNTREAFELYISQSPQGRYVEEARAKIDALDNVEVTPDEYTAAHEVIERHFNALGNNNQAALAGTLAPQINNYIGKANPELEDIYAYMHTVHRTGRSLIFLVKNDSVKKVTAGGRSLYSVQFMLDEETYSSDAHSAIDSEFGTDEEADHAPKPIDVKHFKGAAVLDEDMKITSLVLRQ